jgi:hypothetical protein
MRRRTTAEAALAIIVPTIRRKWLIERMHLAYVRHGTNIALTLASR